MVGKIEDKVKALWCYLTIQPLDNRILDVRPDLLNWLTCCVPINGSGDCENFENSVNFLNKLKFIQNQMYKESDDTHVTFADMRISHCMWHDTT